MIPVTIHMPHRGHRPVVSLASRDSFLSANEKLLIAAFGVLLSLLAVGSIIYSRYFHKQ